MTEKKKGMGLVVVKENLENLSICLLFKVIFYLNFIGSSGKGAFTLFLYLGFLKT